RAGCARFGPAPAQRRPGPPRIFRESRHDGGEQEPDEAGRPIRRRDHERHQAEPSDLWQPLRRRGGHQVDPAGKAKCADRHGCASRSRLAVFRVTTKPCGPVASPLAMFELTIPMTSPRMLNIGPPEFSVSIVASVWKNSASGIVRYAVLGDQRAWMEPMLSEEGSREGAPMMKTLSPTRTVSESAIGDATASAGTRSSCSRDRSAEAGADATTRAATVPTLGKRPEIPSMPWTTSPAVSTWPVAEMRTPAPVSVMRVSLVDIASRPRARMTTTDGATFWATC